MDVEVDVADVHDAKLDIVISFFEIYKRWTPKVFLDDEAYLSNAQVAIYWDWY